MDLTSYVASLGRELAVAAEVGGDEARALVERLSGPLESAIRLTLLQAISAAADEITRDLAPGSVEVRLRGLDPNFVVTPPPVEQRFEDPGERPAEPEPSAPTPVDSGPSLDEGATARINFRLPEQLKAAIEEAAAREGRSVNAWLVRVTSAALQPQQPAQRPPAPQPQQSGRRGARHYTGWVR
ncbi:ribbon-helix-helix protein, CopG family [Goodfellowiella coeruleoviolacea]|nr:ribbon-helix-helix protein, CopG family [Goodfellowiella coeruleoviolacea]